MNKRIGIVVLALTFAASAFATVVVIQPASEGVDAGIYSGGPTWNGGTSVFLTQNWGSSVEARGLVQFDLSPIPTGATINSATLDLWCVLPNSTNYNFGIYRITASWGEMTVTWNTQPAFFATAVDIKMVSGAAGSQVTWTLTPLVQQWVNGTYTNYGFLVKRVDMNNPTAWPYFASSDNTTASYRPRLTVDYAVTGVAPTSLGRVKALYQ